jgi:hypothetical protein
LHLLRFVLRPFGHLALMASLLALWSCRRLLGDKDELGYFAGRLSAVIWRYPEVTRRGVQLAWALWAVLLAIALSPLDPIASRWDEVALALAALLLWHRYLAWQRGVR